jgi:hypothetical protein
MSFSQVPYIYPPPQNLNADIGDIVITQPQDMVRKKLLALDVNKSSGPNDLHPKLLKEVTEQICKPLTTLHQK